MVCIDKSLDSKNKVKPCLICDRCFAKIHKMKKESRYKEHYFRTARKQIQPAKHKTMGCLANLFYVYCVLGTILGSGDEHWIR